MADLTQKVMRELTKLACERVREAVMTVGQLIENDQQRAGLLTSVALDLVQGAAQSLAEDTGAPLDDEIAVVVSEMLLALGGQKLVTDMMRVRGTKVR